MFVALLSGALLGFLGAKMLFLGWLTIIPWGIVSFLLGYFSVSPKQSAQQGALYGFVLGFVFILVGYQGSASLLTRTPFFIAIGLFCVLCSVPLSVLGYFLQDMRKK